MESEGEHEEMISSHWRMTRRLSVSHTSQLNHKKHTIAAKPCRKMISRRILLFWFRSINSDLRSCSNKKKTTRDLFFSDLGDHFPPLPSLISVDDVLCLLPSDLLDKTWGEMKEDKKHENKSKEMKWGKSDFSVTKNFDSKNKRSKGSPQKKPYNG